MWRQEALSGLLSSPGGERDRDYKTAIRMFDRMLGGDLEESAYANAPDAERPLSAVVDTDNMSLDSEGREATESQENEDAA